MVEAAQRSGALITVDHALDLGREIYALPGRIDATQSAGTNMLIADGAGIVTDVSSTVAALAALAGIERLPASESAAARPRPLTGRAEGAVWQALRQGLHLPEEINRATGLPLAQVMATLLGLELAGQIRREPGMRYHTLRSEPGCDRVRERLA